MRERLKKDICFILLIYLITRLMLIFIKFSINEFSTANVFFEALRNYGTPIYETHRSFIPPQIYPPLFYYIAYILFFLGGSYLSMKLFWLIFDFLCLIFVIKIAKIMLNSKKKRALFVYLYLLCPFIFLLTSLRGVGEIITLFFILSSFYYFIKEKYVFSYIFLSLGILYGFLPVLMCIPYFLFLINQKEKKFKKILVFLPIFIIIFLMTSLPFFLIYGQEYLNDLALIINRSDYSIGFYLELPDFIEQEIFHLEIFGFILSITIYRLILISVVIISIFLFIWKLKVNSKEKLVISTIFYMILLPFLAKSFHFRNLIFLVPFLLLFLLSKNSLKEINLERIRKNTIWQLITFSICNIVILVLFVINVFQSYDYSFSRESFYIVFILYCILWGFLLLIEGLMSILFLEGFLLFYSIFLLFFIVYGYVGIYLLIFLIIYIIISFYTFSIIFKNWNYSEII